MAQNANGIATNNNYSAFPVSEEVFADKKSFFSLSCSPEWLRSYSEFLFLPAANPVYGSIATFTPTRVKSFDIGLANVHVCVEGKQMWGGMRRWRDKDSHPSHQIPTLQFKTCPPLSEFTTLLG